MIKRFISLALTLVASASVLTMATPDTATAMGTGNCQTRFLTFPAWYRYLTDVNCNVTIHNVNEIAIIPLNIVEAILMLVGYAAVFYIIWGGFRYIKSRGEPSATATAKSTILNGVLGLGIALGSTAIVNVIASSISGTATDWGLPNVAASDVTLAGIMNSVVFPIAGVVAVIFIIIGGILFAISQGDPGKVKNARNTIIYSVVGLVVIIMAFAIVQLILGRFAQ